MSLRFLLILLAMLFGWFHRAYGDIITLTSADLPITLGSTFQNDTIRFAGTSVTTPNHAIIVATSGVLIDGQGDTLFYGTSGGSNSEAILVEFNGDVFRCQNLVIVHDPGNDGFDLDTLSTGAIENTNVYLSNPDGVRFYKCTFYVFGYNAKNIDSFGSGVTVENVVLDSCRFYNYCTSYGSRHNYDGASIRLEQRGTFTGADFACSIRYCNVYIAPQMAMSVFGKYEETLPDAVGVFIHNCSTWVDARNEGGGQNANQYGIHISGATVPIRIMNNYIGAGTKYGGSRGIIMQSVRGFINDSVKVWNNRVNIWSGPDVENPSGECRGLRVRAAPGSNSGWDYLSIVNNNVEICVDTNTLTTHIGRNGYAFNLTAYDADNGRGHGFVGGNTFTVRSLSNSTLIAGAGAHVGIDPTFTGVLPTIFQGNKWISSDRPYWLADDYNGIGCHDASFFQDTLGFLPGGDSGFNVSDRATYFIGDDKDGVGNIAMNAYYINGTTDTNILLATTSTGDEDLLLAQRIKISAVGTNSQLVANAGFKVWDGNGTLVLDDNSVAVGETTFTFRYWKTYGDAGAGSDSNMNPFDVWVFVTGDTIKLTDTTIRHTAPLCLPVHLASTAGSLSAADTCEVTLPTECPSITLVSPPHNATLEDYNIDLVANLFDTDGDTLDLTLFGELENPSPDVEIADTTLVADATWTFNWGPLTEDKRYYWQVRAVDTSACTTWSAIRSFIVDSITLPQAGSNYNIVPGTVIR